MKRFISFLLVGLVGLALVVPISSSLSAGTLKVTSPNGGQKWKTGKSHAIKWVKGNAGAQVKIQLLKSGKHYQWISKKTKNDGKYAWEIPSTVVTGSAYKIKITSIKNKKVIDVSDKVFAISKLASSADADALEVTTPNGGQKWTVGKSYAIKWVAGNGGYYVKIQLYKSGKHYKWISKKTKNDGKYAWKIPTTVVAGSAYKIKITAKTKSSITDSSDKTFTISKSGGGGSLKVSAPNGGETLDWNKRYAIKWDKGDAGSFVRIFLLKSGKRYKTISLKTKNDGQHWWTVPATTAYSSTYKIRVQSVTDKTINDDSDANFTIGSTLEVTTPNGGESWSAGSTYTITWDEENAGSYVKIYLYDSGSLDSAISTYTSNDGSYSWSIPSTQTGSSAYKIRVQSYSDSSIYDDSDSSFTIERSTLEVTTPNGGESWNAGSTYNITWDEENAGSYVKIYLYDSGSLDSAISTYTTNDGSYSWSIPSTQTSSSAYKIRVQSYSDSSIYDESDSNFTIEDEGLPSGDYQYLYDLNAHLLGGYTTRWQSSTINVSGASNSWEAEFNRWPSVNFNFGASGDISIAYGLLSSSYCGVASTYYTYAGKITRCDITINSLYDPFGSSCLGVITHEVGHCIGVFGHTSDGGLMDPCSACGENVLTSPLKDMINLLYSLEPGTNINSELSRTAAQRNRQNSKYDPQDKTIRRKRFIHPIRQ